MKEIDTDVLVIGAGVAGALVAWRLAMDGHGVVLVDAGAHVTRTDAVGRWAAAASKTLGVPYRDTPDDPYSSFPDGAADYHYLSAPGTFKSTYVRRVGGSTWHWQGSTPRLVPNDFRMRSQYGVGVDWPIDYDTLESWYTRAEHELGVAGDHAAWDGFHGAWRSAPFPMTPIWPSYLDKVVADKVDGLEFEGTILRVRSTPQARNSRPYQGRPPCAGNSSCIPICPIQAKYDATVHVGLALQAGATLLDQSVATRIVTGPGGRIDGVEAATWSAAGEVTRRTLRARRYVLAAHAIESARLLLVSEIGTPSVVGRNLMDHPTAQAVGLSPEPVYGFRGPPVTSGIDEWRDGTWRSNYAAWKMSLGNDGHGRLRTPEKAVQQWMGELGFGNALRRRIEEDAPRMLRISWASEQLPDPGNYVELDPANKDRLGVPLVRLNYGVSQYTLSSFAKARALVESVFAVAGIERPETDPAGYYGGSGHIIGTCRMGNDPTTSVVDPDCRVHGHRNLYLAGTSVFPTAGTANPTLTVAALALRLAEHMHSELRTEQ